MLGTQKQTNMRLPLTELPLGSARLVSAGTRAPLLVSYGRTIIMRYSDGTPYHQFGTTCYAWVHQPLGLQEQTLQTLATSAFNKVRFWVFPKAYTYDQNEPERFAFTKGTDGKFDFTRPDPEGRISESCKISSKRSGGCRF